MANESGNTRAYSQEHILNKSFDRDLQQLMVEGLGFDGQNLQRLNADNMATKITVVGSVTYVAKASTGALQADAVWQCKKIDETTGTVITWANGDSNFDNTATDLTALTYS